MSTYETWTCYPFYIHNYGIISCTAKCSLSLALIASCPQVTVWEQDNCSQCRHLDVRSAIHLPHIFQELIRIQCESRSTITSYQNTCIYGKYTQQLNKCLYLQMSRMREIRQKKKLFKKRLFLAKTGQSVKKKQLY